MRSILQEFKTHDLTNHKAYVNVYDNGDIAIFGREDGVVELTRSEAKSLWHVLEREFGEKAIYCNKEACE